MPTFTHYPHIERLGNDEVEGITNGKCYVFPKIDGTQGSVWLEDGKICAGSRTRQLSLSSDNAGFYAYITKDKAVASLLDAYPHLILYGEWLVPHNFKSYLDSAWRHFYVFDVYDSVLQRFLDYDSYVSLLLPHGITHIPVMEIVYNPTDEYLAGLLNRNTYLIKDGGGPGEGIVIKRYDYCNRYERTTWAKLVRSEFREHDAQASKRKELDKISIEMRLAQEFVTPGRVAKLKERLRETGPLSSKRIPELLGRVWHDIITEEMWNILSKHKRVTIDFEQFQRAVTEQVKVLSPELFDTRKEQPNA